MDASTLAKVYGINAALAGLWAPPLTDTMARYGIDQSAKRQAAFLATIGVESGNFKWTTELWGPTEAQKRYDVPADKAKELGNTVPGDGFKYRGRGLIMITGRANYAACGAALGLDLVTNPNLLTMPPYAARSAGWFWSTHNLNTPADQGAFETVTLRVNGGLTGWTERLALYTTFLTEV